MKFDYRSLMSGKHRGPIAMLMRAALRVASVPYGVVVNARNRRFDSGKSEIHRLDVPVISVGNLTTGGTGKTPIVCYLAKMLREQGLRVAIVSRGYGRGDNDENDEALELHSRLPDVPHVQDPDRFAAASIAVDELEAQVILMDDGFQHRRLARDVDIVVIDATCPFGYGYVLPRGLLREPVLSLARASLVIVTRCDVVSADRIADIESTVAAQNPSVPVVFSEHQPDSLLTYPDQRESVESLSGGQVATICAIGNPDAFVATVRGCGANVVASKALPDHDAFAPETVESLRQWVRDLGDSIDQVVCTHKDLVKLRTDRLGGKPLSAILIQLHIDDAKQIEEVIKQATVTSDSS